MSDADIRLAELIAHAEIGLQGQAFLQSDLGRTVIGMAKQQREASEKALVFVDPDDKKAITALQNNAKLALYFEQWLEELISKGENAMEVFKNEQES